MDTDDIRAATKDTLLGFGRANGSGLAALLEVADGQRIARIEIERRTTRIIETFDDDALHAIVAGTRDVHTLLGEVVADRARQILIRTCTDPPRAGQMYMGLACQADGAWAVYVRRRVRLSQRSGPGLAGPALGWRLRIDQVGKDLLDHRPLQVGRDHLQLAEKPPATNDS